MAKKIRIEKNGKNALIIVDAEKDFLLKIGKLLVAGIVGELSFKFVVKLIIALCLKPFDYRAMTRDVHDEDHIECKVIKPHCLKNSTGVLFHKAFASIMNLIDEIVEKGRQKNLFSFSVATSHAFNEHIGKLRAAKIENIFLVGWAFDYCVGESAIDYERQGFKVYIVRTCTQSVSEETAVRMNKRIEGFDNIKVIKFDDIA